MQRAIEAMQHRHDVRIVQAIANPPRDVQSQEDDINWRSKTGRVSLGVELRL
jgi:hypothetical protein